jgi:nucleoside-diphosphate-sugar epimerase
MQLGMIGLGRMGANMVRRLMKNGHTCVVYDRSAETIAALAKEGAIGATSLEDFVAKLKPPRAAWLMVPAAAVEGRHDHRRRQLLLHRRHPPADRAAVEGHPLRRRRHLRRRVGTRARLLHDDRR